MKLVLVPDRVRKKPGSSPYDCVIVDGDCLRWTAAHDTGGYGQIRDPITKRLMNTHVWFWEQVNGPVEPGMELDHVWERGCRFRDCVKIAHLEQVTHQENVKRGVQGRKTHCVNGHEFDVKNTYRRNRNGKRRCRACDAAAARERKARRREAQAG